MSFTSGSRACSIQSDFEKSIRAEIGNQTFEFEADVVAQMLSPKLHREDIEVAPLPFLERFDCFIDDPVVESAMKSFHQLIPLHKHSGWDKARENPNYLPLVNFLNDCVDSCNTVYDTIQQNLSKEHRFKVKPRAERWLPHLRFRVLNKPTIHGTQGSNPTMPDFVGVDHPGIDNIEHKDFHCEWGPQERGKQGFQIMIPGGVRNKWPELVCQARSYARSQFDVSPLQIFTLVIALNYNTQELRYIIFHCDGLSATVGLQLGKPEDCMRIQKVLLSVMLWQCAEDAGIPSSTDSRNFYLSNISSGVIPSSVDSSRFCINSVLYHSLSIRGHSTFVTKLSRAPHDESWSQDAPRQRETYWDVFNVVPPEPPGCRVLWQALHPYEGQSLEGCLNAKDLRACLVQSLLGWLSVYQAGYMHRDVSIGNLLELHQDMPSKPFSALNGINGLLEGLSKLGQPPAEECEALRKIAGDLDTLVKQAGFGNTCKAVITDGDMSVYLPDYNFSSSKCRGSLSGTVEFMSTDLRDAMEVDKPYLQSPLDDLWSFFWTALWAISFNHWDKGKDGAWRAKKWRTSASDRSSILVEIFLWNREKEGYPEIFSKMAPLLRNWFTCSVNELDASHQA